jgi:NAD(P)-dependent dehydrogenase (short-subunit alcohol dehydrogenase family)
VLLAGARLCAIFATVSVCLPLVEMDSMAANKTDLNGKVAFITGAASGIGCGIAHMLAANGAAVVVADASAGAAEQVAGEIATGGGHSLAITVDVTSYAALEAAVGHTIAQLGGLDFVFANAGILGPTEFMETTPEAWQQVLDVNLTGVINTCRAAMPHLMERCQGRIIITASPNGVRPGAHVIAYRVSKAAVLMAMRCLALVLAPYGVTVNAISPGVTMTAMEKDYVLATSAQWGITAAQYVADRSARIPLGRFTEVDEVAALALYLVSDAAAIVTGQAIGVDGGMEIV